MGRAAHAGGVKPPQGGNQAPVGAAYLEIGGVRRAMISAARVSVLAAATGATLLIVGTAVEPATAQDNDCKADIVKATGRGKFRPFTKTKELEGKGSAMADAVTTWQREVAASFGERWKLWSEAKDKSFECGITQGKILSGLVQCTIRGRPCATPESAPAPAVVAGSDKGTGRKAGDRDDDDDRHVHPGGRSWRYRQEMARQEYLANWRERREDWAWQREKARQRYLENARDRREEYGWARVNERERWLARERD
jgi:hypothetical protein